MKNIGIMSHQMVKFYFLQKILLTFSIGRDLLTRLLDRDMNSRINIQDALNHPWIAVKFPSKSSTLIIPQNREGLKKYANKNQHHSDSRGNSGYDNYYP